jgi:quercetin dioxygenase-like cupin family protein
VVLAGRGRVKLDDDVHEVGPLDAIRVAPHVLRAFAAGPEGLELLVFGPHHAGDGEIIKEGFWE